MSSAQPQARRAQAHRERLLPSWWAWLIAAALIAMLAIAYGAALGAWAGWALGILLGIVTSAVLVGTSPVVQVDSTGLRAGRATLPRDAIAHAEPIGASSLRDLRGPGADGRTYTLLRPWVAPGAVHVILDDPLDPHPAWLITSRHPEAIVEALTATMDACTPEEDA